MLLLVLGTLAPATAFAGAFEKRTGAGEYPSSPIDRPLALPKEMLYVDLDYSFRYGRDGYNNGSCAGVDATNTELIPERCYAPASTPGCDNDGDGVLDDIGPNGGDGIPDCTTSGVTGIYTDQDPRTVIGYAAIATHRLNIHAAYGITDNWTFWADIPFYYMRERYDASSSPGPGRTRDDARMLLDERACRSEEVDDPNTPCNELPNTPGNLPLRRTTGLGDVEIGFLYQWVNFKSEGGLRRSLVTKLWFRLPSGNESTAESDLVATVDDPATLDRTEFLRRKSLITGSGTLDAALSIAYKHAIIKSLAATLEVGYIGRIEGQAQYIRQFDPNESGGVIFPPNPDDPFTTGDFNFNGKVDFGDELFAKLNVTFAPSKKLWFDLGVKYLYRFPTRVAQAGFVPSGTVVMIDENTERTFNISNGTHYRDIPSSRGYLLTITPTITYKVTELLELSLYADIHVAGKNSFYLHNNSFNNAVDATVMNQDERYGGTGFHAYLPMEALGFALNDQIILGNVGLKASLLF